MNLAEVISPTGTFRPDVGGAPIKLLHIKRYRVKIVRSEKPLNPNSVAVLTWMKKKGAPVYSKDIRSATGLKHDELGSALTQLETRGLIARRRGASGFFVYWVKP